ncbi:MAG: hypothetical protein ACRDCN_03355 [Tannerellaceae bacterium]
MKSFILSFVFVFTCLCSANAQIQMDTLTLTSLDGITKKFAASDTAAINTFVNQIIESSIAYFDTLSVDSPTISEEEKEMFKHLKSLNKDERTTFLRDLFKASINTLIESMQSLPTPSSLSDLETFDCDSTIKIDITEKVEQLLEE